jgi:hypothetical protein
VIFDIAPIELLLVADNHSFGVADIQRAGCEQLENYKVLGRACADIPGPARRKKVTCG